MMTKLLARQEAEEIINTMLDEWGLDHIVVIDKGEFWGACDKPKYAEKKFLWWKWKKMEYAGEVWVKADSLTELVVEVETALEEDYTIDAENTERIRREHAARLLTKELSK